MTPRDYAGAVGRATLTAAKAAGGGFAIQPKRDGMYVTLCLDGAGAVAEVLSRAGKPVQTDLVGHRIGAPWSVLCGELEASTEAGVRAAEARGFAMVHVFDAIQVGSTRVAAEPYRARRDAAYRAWAAVAEETPGRAWVRDRAGKARSRGRFCTEAVRDWRRCEIVPQAPASEAERCWADWVDRVGGEGLVLVALGARLGARGAKRKIKAADTLDAVVLASDAKRAIVQWVAAGLSFTVGTAGRGMLEVGAVVEIKHESFYDSGIPKFPRVVRVRTDLS